MQIVGINIFKRRIIKSIILENNLWHNQNRMLGYLYRISDPRPEDVVDEMLAILSDRNAIIQKKELEHAQATINKVYREGL